MVLILDFGSQVTQLIARRVRELNLYCEIKPYNNFELTDDVDAIILSGSPFSVLDSQALHVDLDRLLNHGPVLGICYGAQYMAHMKGGQVRQSATREYGHANLTRFVDSEDPILEGVNPQAAIWMSHGDTIFELPDSFLPIAGTSDAEVAIFKGNPVRYDHPIYGLQFHPEVTHSEQGLLFLENFLIHIVGLTPDWTPLQFVEDAIDFIREKVGDEHVILGLSGGVDSTVAAGLLHQAIGQNLVCIFVDNGLLRKNEFEEVLESYHEMGLHIIGVRAAEEFYRALTGVIEPEAKRKAIGKVFIDVFEREAKKFPEAKWLAQGTIYPDVIESLSVHGPSATIKSHHNVGGLPEKLHLKIIEPLRSLFKDEVRKVGEELSIPKAILGRHPFPGPGLGIRILGEITPERVTMLQEADYIYLSHLRDAGWYDKIWQAGTILLPVRSVGVMGDERTYEATVALRAVNSLDGMTANWTHIPYELLGKISSDIINKVKGINRVVYDISTKPPATIEWE